VRARDGDSRAGGRARRATAWFLAGQLTAVLAANLLWFTAAQHRMPLVVPLAFAAGPVLEASLVRRTWRVGSRLAMAFAAMLALQAFWPRPAPVRPSAAHYYNLAAAFESLGRYPEALAHYQHAITRSPKQPMFYLRFARLAVAVHRDAAAQTALETLRTLPDVHPDIARAAERQRQLLAQRARRDSAH